MWSIKKPLLLFVVTLVSVCCFSQGVEQLISDRKYNGGILSVSVIRQIEGVTVTSDSLIVKIDTSEVLADINHFNSLLVREREISLFDSKNGRLTKVVRDCLTIDGVNLYHTFLTAYMHSLNEYVPFLFPEWFGDKFDAMNVDSVRVRAGKTCIYTRMEKGYLYRDGKLVPNVNQAIFCADENLDGPLNVTVSSDGRPTIIYDIQKVSDTSWIYKVREDVTMSDMSATVGADSLTIPKKLIEAGLYNCMGDTIYLKDTDGWILVDLWRYNCSPCTAFHQSLKTELDSFGHRRLEKNGIRIFCINPESRITDYFSKYVEKYAASDIMFVSSDISLRDIKVWPKYILLSPDREIVYEGSDKNVSDIVIDLKKRYENKGLK